MKGVLARTGIEIGFTHQLTKLRYKCKIQAGSGPSDAILEQAVEAFYKIPYLKSGVQHKKKERPVIISLTTIPSRIDKVWLTTESLLRQRRKPDKILLWLAKDEFQGIDIPELLKKQQDRGLEIRYYRNLRSYKKFYPTMLGYPNAYVLLVDDDHIYSERMLEEMLAVSSDWPDSIICNRSHKVRADKNGIFPYLRWIPYEERKDIREVPSFRNFFTGNCGVMLPAWRFGKAVFREDVFMKIAPTADDVWLNFNAWRSKIQTVNTKGVFGYAIPVHSSADKGLSLKNTAPNADTWKCGNDDQIDKVLQYLNLDVREYI